MKNLVISFLLLFSVFSRAQFFPEGIPFQAQIFGQSGNFLSNTTIGVRFNLRSTSASGILVWQEDHLILLNAYGNFSAVVGTGIATGAGTASSFSSIDWSSGIYFLELLVDEDNIGSYVSVSNEQLMSVPFAYHAKTTSQQFALSGLTDVDTSGIQVGDILKWDGVKWVPQPDDLVADTVNYSQQSGHAVYSDTATFALNCLPLVWSDSSYFAWMANNAVYADSANFSWYAGTADYATSADTATYSLGNWGLAGNASTNPSSNFLGTTDSVDLVFKSYNLERMRIKGNGYIGVGTATPLADFHIENSNGVLFTGTHGVGTIPTSGAGTRMMWYPAKSAFRAGYVTGTNWDNSLIGEYSFAAGYNTRASGMYSVAFGLNSLAIGAYSFVAGQGCTANGSFAFASGENATAFGDYGVALGRGGSASGYGSVAIGYHPTASADYALALGNYCTASGINSVAMGYRAQAIHNGSFIFSDESNISGFTQTTAANQFMVKASGGTIFYTNAALTTGVVLAPGAGAWSTLSDRNSKENIVLATPSNYLEKLDSIEVFQWNYLSQDSSMVHIGPMAQDFYAVFKFGNDSTSINSGDFDGVNLILLKALNEKVAQIEMQQQEMDQMGQELLLLRQERMRMELLLQDLENRVNSMYSSEARASLKKTE